MTRYADPSRCPDCGATITPGASACGTCALSLSGETARQLFVTLSQADDLLVTLRAASTPTHAAAATAVAPAPEATLPAAPFTAAPFPTRPTTHRPPHPGLSAASVPQLLLALGAGCLLVAALVFLAVTWSVMGVGGRTATLVGFTVVAGGLATWMARRGLRAATESLALVGYGLLALDVIGADNAGWFGDLSTAALLVVVGAVLALAGAAGATAVRRTAIPALTGAEVVAVIGTGLVAFGVGVGDWMPSSPSLVAATLVGAAATVAAHRLRMSVATVGAAVVTGLAWVSLTSVALDRAFVASTWSRLWLDLEVWPLLVSAALVATVALLRPLPLQVRVAASSVAVLLAAVAVVAPAHAASATTVTLAAAGVLVVVGTATQLPARPWGLSGAATQAVFGGGVLLVATLQGSLALNRMLDASDPVWSGELRDTLPTPSYGDGPAPWLLPLVVVVLLGTLAALAGASRVVERAAVPLADLRTVAAVLAAALVATLALYPVALWLVVGALLLVAGTFTGWWLAARSWVPLVPAALFLAGALVVSLHSAGLTAFALAATVVIATGAHLRSRVTELAAVAGALLAAVVAAAVWTGGHLLDADPTWVALTGLLLLGALVLVAPYAPTRWWAADGPVFARTGLEAGAGAAALPLALAGVLLAPEAHDATWAAVYLTVAGVVVTAMSLLREDRRKLGWAGGGLLALASWVRLWDLGVHAPEPYTLPSAAALLVVGLVHLRRSPGSGTMTALAPGLSLALVPSLLWALTEPAGLRALLLGLGCLALMLVGARLGWTAPIFLGATVGALLVLRLAAPYVGAAVPRWVLLGAAGALLIGVGATWERRLTGARHLMAYVRALR
jgi:hypothetical protein